MYAKIFQSIYDGTLVEDWRALITFEQLLILSDADGIVDMTAHAIARRTGIPIEHIEAGIRYLEQPDPNSRTETAEGRRIIRLNEERSWGWQIVNHSTYRDMRTADDRRDYMRKYMKDYRKSQQNQEPSKQESLQKLTVSEGKSELAQLANTYTDTYTDTDTNNYITSGLTPDLDKPKRNYQQEAIEVLKFLNEKAGKNFRALDASGKPTASLTPIIQRLKTGITVQDCKTVIARKHREWSTNSEGKFGKGMLEYMRPKTLFAASNFENYLGQCVVSGVKNG
jgi:uncharacterized phage protein (TIGR02220 family)